MSGTRFSQAPRLVLGAAYTLWLVKRVIFGEIANDKVAALKDLNGREFLVLGLLALAVLLVGLWPAPCSMSCGLRRSIWPSNCCFPRLLHKATMIAGSFNPSFFSSGLVHAWPEIFLSLAACAILMLDLLLKRLRSGGWIGALS